MKRPTILLFLIFLVAFANVGYANSTALNERDYLLEYIPTGETIQIGKASNFMADTAKVYWEHNSQTGRDYVGGITVYSRDYLTSRGVRVGDLVAKVKEYYGESCKVTERNDYNCLTYIEERQILKVHFYLDKKNEQVIAINLNIYPVGAPPMINLADGEYH